MNKQRIEDIEILEEEMMEAWNNHYSNSGGLVEGLGNAMRIQGKCYYDADKKKILKKKRWDKECDKFVKKMKSEIRKYN